jgi:hypothetical protein
LRDGSAARCSRGTHAGAARVHFKTGLQLKAGLNLKTRPLSLSE